MSDDHTSNAIGAYESRLAVLNPTPNIDKLADEGVKMTNVFCGNSICTPSRATILSGNPSHINGVTVLSHTFDGSQTTFPKLMQADGYETAVVGKWHLKSEPTGFDYYKVLPGQGKYFNPTFRIQGAQAWPGNTIQHQGHSSDVIGDISLNWLTNIRDTSKPFLLLHHFKAPHGLWEFAPRFDTLYDNVEIPEPSTLFEDKTHRSAGSETYGNSMQNGVATNRFALVDMNTYPSLSDVDKTKAGYQAYLKAYLRCVKGIDENVGRLLQYLRDENLMDNTVIMYTGDQGMYLGEHDLYDKRWMYEEAFRMPLLIRYPKEIAANSFSPILANNTDFGPTILDFAGLPTPSVMQGSSFKEVITGSVIPNDWRQVTYYRYWMNHNQSHDVNSHLGIRTYQYKLIYFDGKNGGDTGWELYDLLNDPEETKNLAEDLSYADVLINMKLELELKMAEIKEIDIPTAADFNLTPPPGWNARWTLQSPKPGCMDPNYLEYDSTAVYQPNGYCVTSGVINPPKNQLIGNESVVKIYDVTGRFLFQYDGSIPDWKKNSKNHRLNPGIYLLRLGVSQSKVEFLLTD